MENLKVQMENNLYKFVTDGYMNTEKLCNPSTEDLIVEKNETIEKLKNRYDRFIDMYADGEITREKYLEKRSDLEKQICSLKEDVKKLQGEKNVCNKKKGVKTGNYALKLDDIRKISDYFLENERWINHLHVTLQLNTGRRVSDIINLRWCDLMDTNGNFMENIKVFREKKTGKEVSIHINDPIRYACKNYIEKLMLDPATLASYDREEPKSYVFYQYAGTHRGRVITQKALNEALHTAAHNVGITENVTTHSLRRGFGEIMRMLHINDPNCMEVLRGIFNHSSTLMTSKYIGLTKKTEDQYYEDFGNAYDRCVLGGEKMELENRDDIVVKYKSEYVGEIADAYKAGVKNANDAEATVEYIMNTMNR